jgi:hypothetical protein
LSKCTRSNELAGAIRTEVNSVACDDVLDTEELDLDLIESRRIGRCEVEFHGFTLSERLLRMASISGVGFAQFDYLIERSTN